MTDGKDAPIVDTLARLLDSFGKKEEACGIIKEAIKDITSMDDRAELWKTAMDLGCGR
jgi:hypothetical protein